MKPKQTGTLAVGLLVVSIALGLYLWRHITHTRADSEVAGRMQSYTCPHCDKAFEISVAEATAMRRNNGDVSCPYCGKGGTRKDNVAVDMNGPRQAAPPENEGDSADDGHMDRDRPHQAPAAGRTPKTGK